MPDRGVFGTPTYLPRKSNPFVHITMLEELKKREAEGRFIHVGLAGAGAMGLGIAWQIGKTPGMRLSFVTDLNQAAAQKAKEVYGKECVV